MSPPSNNGGRPLDFYQAECLGLDSDSTYTDFEDVSVGPVFVNVEAGQHVKCRARAFNHISWGEPSPWSDYGTAVEGLPGPPPEGAIITAETPGPRKITVEFDPPSYDGGSPITGFTVRCFSFDGGVTGIRSGAGSPIVVPNLSGNRHYRCQALASKAWGDGPYGDSGDSVLVPPASRLAGTG